MNRFKIFFYNNFSKNKKIRKYIGGYWEKWAIERTGEFWLKVKEKDAFDKYHRPSLTHKGIPFCEYYDLEFFGYKTDFTDKMKKKLDRRRKLKRIKKNLKE